MDMPMDQGPMTDEEAERWLSAAPDEPLSPEEVDRYMRRLRGQIAEERKADAARLARLRRVVELVDEHGSLLLPELGLEGRRALEQIIDHARACRDAGDLED